MVATDKPFGNRGIVLFINPYGHFVRPRTSGWFLPVFQVAIWLLHDKVSLVAPFMAYFQSLKSPLVSPRMSLERTVLLMSEMDLTWDFGSDEVHSKLYSAQQSNGNNWTLGRARNGAALTRLILWFESGHVGFNSYEVEQGRLLG